MQSKNQSTAKEILATGHADCLLRALDELIAGNEATIRAYRLLREAIGEASGGSLTTPYASDVEHDPDPQIEQKRSVEPRKSPVQNPIKFTDVRKALAQKSHEGYTEEVRKIILDAGAQKLSEVSPEQYPAMMQALEAIG